MSARYVAIGGLVAASIVYLLIGAGLVWVGDSASGGRPDLSQFGVMASITFALAAAAVARLNWRPLWVAIGVLQILVIVGYVAAANVRVPAYEPWGIFVKACQVLVLVAVAYMAVRDRGTAEITAHAS